MSARAPSPSSGEMAAGVALATWLLGLHVALELLRMRLPAPPPDILIGTEVLLRSALAALSVLTALLAAAVGSVVALRGQRLASALWQSLCSLLVVGALLPKAARRTAASA